jgi:outer membrane protein
MKLKIAFTLLIISTSFSIAQNKVGTIDSDYIVNLMPETKVAMDTSQKYGSTLDSSFNIQVVDFKNRVDKYTMREKEMGVLEKKTIQQELAALEKELQKYQKNANMLLKLRRDELMRPLYKKLSDLIAVVSKENGYSQVFTITGNQFAYFDSNFDITKLVMDKLGISTPTDRQ